VIFMAWPPALAGTACRWDARGQGFLCHCAASETEAIASVMTLALRVLHEAEATPERLDMSERRPCETATIGQEIGARRSSSRGMLPRKVCPPAG
jgi:hypothetical protein